MNSPWFTIDEKDLSDANSRYSLDSSASYHDYYGVFTMHPKVIANKLSRPPVPFLEDTNETSVNDNNQHPKNYPNPLCKTCIS